MEYVFWFDRFDKYNQFQCCKYVTGVWMIAFDIETGFSELGWKYENGTNPE